MTTPKGFTHGLVFDGTGGAEDIAWADIAHWRPAQGVLWLHFHFEEEEARQWLAEEAGISELAYESLVSENTRPRVVSRGEKLLMALRGVNTNPGQDPEDMVSIRLWTDGTRIITTYRRLLLSTRDILEAFKEGVGPASVSEFVVILNDRLVERMSDTVEQLEEQMLEMEERVLEGNTEGMRKQLVQIRIQAVVLRRHFSPQREALNRLVQDRIPWLDEHTLLALREVNDKLIRHIEAIDAIWERATVVQEELISSVSEAMNQRTYVLTIAAAIFLPLGFFTGLMGINVGGMPGVENPMGFWLVTGISVITIVVMSIIFRLKKWI